VKVATPFTAATDVVPVNEPAPDASVAVTTACDDVTSAPPASWISTTGCGESREPAFAPPGCCLIATWVARGFGSDELPHAVANAAMNASQYRTRSAECVDRRGKRWAEKDSAERASAVRPL